MGNEDKIENKERNRLVTNYENPNMEIEKFTEWLDKTVPDEIEDETVFHGEMKERRMIMK